MRAAAEIEPVALLVDFELLVFGDRIDQLDLEQFAFVAKHFLRFVARPHFLGEGFVARDDFAHFFLDGVEILWRERLIAEEIVVEAVFDHRPDGDLRAGPQRLHGFSQHMRSVVANKFQRPRIVAGQKFDFGVVVDRIGKVGDLTIERHRDRALGQRRRNALGNVEAGDVLGILPTRAVGKGQGDHLSLLSSLLRTSAGKRDRAVCSAYAGEGKPCGSGGDRSYRGAACAHAARSRLHGAARAGGRASLRPRFRWAAAHWFRATARNARANTNAPSAEQQRRRSRAQPCQMVGSATSGPASSSRQPTGRSGQSPGRHSRSKSADAGNGSRPAARTCSDRL